MKENQEQQNGAPLYYAVDRWIGRRGQIEWPARSPDLTRLDFFYEDISRIRIILGMI
jgi:hypothetical protein